MVAASPNGRLRLKDVARVTDGPEPRIGDAAVNGEPGVLLLVWSQYGSNTLEVTEAVEVALAELKPSLDASGIHLEPRLFRPATFIEQSIRIVPVPLFLADLTLQISNPPNHHPIYLPPPSRQ